MKWTKQAEEALAKVPFFVRRRVKKRVEEEAQLRHAKEVTLEHVHACKQKFLKTMEDEVKGHQIETCFGASGCPNRAVIDDELGNELERVVSARNLRDFLKTKVQGPLKMHHEFRISVSDCPNACSRPQITDIGVIAALRPRLRSAVCSGCAACVATCRERALEIPRGEDVPVLNLDKCVSCGQCIKVCPSGALEEAERGYRILVGGKLGRHPQLATELQGIYAKSDVLRIVNRCLAHYADHCTTGERFGEILNRTGYNFCE